MLALRSGKPAFRSKLYGLPEKTTKSEDLQAQAPQAHEGESPQEAFALQVVSARFLFAESLGFRSRPVVRQPRSWFAHRPRRRYSRS
jgi:hypothetical protein